MLNYFRCNHFNAETDIKFPTHGRLSASNAIRWKVYISLCCLYMLFLFYAVYLASPFVIPDSIFAFANVSCIINVTVRNIFIFFNPLIVCFSNWKSRSIRPFTLSMLVLFLYSLFHFFEFLATFVNIRGSVFNGILNISLDIFLLCYLKAFRFL